MAETYAVQQGDTLASIAHDFGFRNYSKIYNHPNNAAFKSQRADPDLIFPSDILYIPDIEQKQVPKPTDARHVFTVEKPPKVLRMRIQDATGKAIANTAYELWVDGKKRTGKTNGNGVLEQRIKPTSKEGRLKIAEIEWPLQIGDLNPAKDTGDNGISGIQMRLKNLGCPPGPIDGVMGSKTTAAVREFQARHAPLKVDGVCGPKTLARLIQEYGC